MTAPKVSIAMLAYNHERFVVQAVESVLVQRTDFPFEIVIGEDCSPDGTRAVLERLAAAHPGIIRLLLPEKNLGMNRNLAATIAACRGEYVALLECDDYWIDPEKLQRQADRLGANPDCAICFTRALVVDEANQPIETAQIIHEVKTTYSLADYLSRVFQPRTCTVMFRRGLFAEFPEWFFRLPVGDFPLHVLNAEHGGFAFLDRVTAAYRIHAGGIWSMWGSARCDGRRSRVSNSFASRPDWGRCWMFTPPWMLISGRVTGRSCDGKWRSSRTNSPLFAVRWRTGRGCVAACGGKFPCCHFRQGLPSRPCCGPRW